MPWSSYFTGDLIPPEDVPVCLLAACEPFEVTVGGRVYVDSQAWLDVGPLRFRESWWLSLLRSRDARMTKGRKSSSSMFSKSRRSARS